MVRVRVRVRVRARFRVRVRVRVKVRVLARNLHLCLGRGGLLLSLGAVLRLGWRRLGVLGLGVVLGLASPLGASGADLAPLIQKPEQVLRLLLLLLSSLLLLLGCLPLPLEVLGHLVRVRVRVRVRAGVRVRVRVRVGLG